MFPSLLPQFVSLVIPVACYFALLRRQSGRAKLTSVSSLMGGGGGGGTCLKFKIIGVAASN